jgi:GxxExxY protein
MDFKPVPVEIDEIAAQIVDAALAVHRALGPGLLESVYEICLAHELGLRKLECRTQVAIPVSYKDVRIEAGLRIDMLVANSVVVELKSVERMLPLFEAQLLSYLKLANLRLGLLINFSVPIIKNGIKRIVL